MRDGQHLAQLVRNKDDPKAIGRQPPQHHKQPLGFLGCQNGSGFIQNEDAGIAIECLEDFNALLLAHREIGNATVDIDLQPALGNDGLNPGARGGASPQGEQRLGAKANIVEAREILGQREMLVHHADPDRQGRARRARRQGCHVPAIGLNADSALVLHIMAEQDVHQRGLAGAVLSQEGEDFALAKVERNVVVGDKGTEPLGDVG